MIGGPPGRLGHNTVEPEFSQIDGIHEGIDHADGIAFASRAVHGLSYRSQSESAFWRRVRQAQKIRAKLGGDPSIYAPFPPRRRGMHRRRYERLKQEVTAIETTGRAILTGARQRRQENRAETPGVRM